MSPDPATAAQETGITPDTVMQKSDMRWWDTALLAGWHVVCISVLLFSIVSHWAGTVGTPAAEKVPTADSKSLQKVLDFSLEDFGDDERTQIKSAQEMLTQLFGAANRSKVMEILQEGTPVDVKKDFKTAPPTLPVVKKLIAHLNGKLIERKLALVEQKRPDGTNIAVLGANASLEEVRRHNRQLIEASFPKVLRQTDLKPVDTATSTESASAATAAKISPDEGKREQGLLMIVIAAGALGACARAGLFFVGYVGQGTALRRWTWYYIMQPFVGAVLALIFYCIVRGGLVIQNTTQTGSANLFFTAGLAGMVGVFSKNALDRMELWFANFAAPGPGVGGTTVQKTKRVTTDDKHSVEPAAPMPTITEIVPASLSLSARETQIVVKGTNFVAGAVVHIEDALVTDAVVNGLQQMTVPLPAAVLQKPVGTVLKILVELPAEKAGGSKRMSAPKDLPVVA